MHNWCVLVRARLPRTGLSAPQYEEVISELASHLEEFYEEQRGQGVPDQLAFDLTLDQIGACENLARSISRVKREDKQMNRRTRTLWLPGFLGILAWAALAVVAQDSRLQIALDHAKLFPVVSPLWLIIQLPLGALGAYTSRRAGGTRLDRIAAGLFPALLLCVSLVVVFLIRALVPPLRGGNGIVGINQLLFWQSARAGIVFPGLALLLGTLPFLRQPTSETRVAD